MRIKRKIFYVFAIILISLSNLCFAVEPSIKSGAAIVVEESTGKILYEKNAYEKMYPASTTKILTAILVIENCNLDDMATVSHNAVYSLPPAYVTANLKEGEQISVGDLLYALMLPSANDAAIVLAEHVGGSVEVFSDMMNQKALEIGCKNTHFVNPNGMHNDEHYTTAYDLYLIADYAMKNETFRKYVTTTTYTLPTTNKYKNTDRICLTTNEFLKKSSKYYNANVIGIKTGTTTEAKNCLISAVEKDGVELISVTLHSDTNSERYTETQALFDYGFNDFDFSNIVEENNVIQNIEVENGNKDTKSLDLLAKGTLTGYINKGTNLSEIQPKIELNEVIQAPIQQGDVLGKVTYTVENIDYTTDLIASHEVMKKIDIVTIGLLIGGFWIFLFGLMLFIKSFKKTKKKKIYR